MNQTHTHRRKVNGSGVQWRKKKEYGNDKMKEPTKKGIRIGKASTSRGTLSGQKSWSRWKTSHRKRRDYCASTSPSSPLMSRSWRSPFSNRSKLTSQKKQQHAGALKRPVVSRFAELRIGAESLMGKIPSTHLVRKRDRSSSTEQRRVYNPYPSTHIFDERLQRTRSTLDTRLFSRDSRIEGSEVIAPWTRRAIVSRRE